LNDILTLSASLTIKVFRWQCEGAIHSFAMKSTRKVMLITGIVNPHVLSLVGRVRHTNALVLADVAFPYWPQIETVDISLLKGVPTILQVLGAILPNFKCGAIYMASEFKEHNDVAIQSAFANACRGVSITFESHVEFKKRVPQAIGLIRTGDGTLYGNMILVSS